MESGNFLIKNNNIVTSVASNGGNRLDNIKGDASEWPFQKLDPSARLHLLYCIHELAFISLMNGSHVRIQVGTRSQGRNAIVRRKTMDERSCVSRSHAWR